jgi:hypothetical protein
MERMLPELTLQRREACAGSLTPEQEHVPISLGHAWRTNPLGGNRPTVAMCSELEFSGGRDRRRSGDLTLFRRALYQLSYPTGWPSPIVMETDRIRRRT